MLITRLLRGGRFHEIVSSDALNVTTACRRTFAREECWRPREGEARGVGCEDCKKYRRHGFAPLPSDYDPPSRPGAAARLRALVSGKGWVTEEIRRAVGMDLVWEGG